jgi:hypothetical protein
MITRDYTTKILGIIIVRHGDRHWSSMIWWMFSALRIHHNYYPALNCFFAATSTVCFEDYCFMVNYTIWFLIQKNSLKLKKHDLCIRLASGPPFLGFKKSAQWGSRSARWRVPHVHLSRRTRVNRCLAQIWRSILNLPGELFEGCRVRTTFEFSGSQGGWKSLEYCGNRWPNDPKIQCHVEFLCEPEAMCCILQHLWTKNPTPKAA